jgi:hypothetical protein
VQTARKVMIGVKRIERRTVRVFTTSAFVATVATPLALFLAPPASASPGSWEMTGCSAEPQGILRGKLRIHNQDTIRPHSYTVKLVWNKGSDRLGSTDLNVGEIRPGQAQDIDASAEAASAVAGEMQAGAVACTVEFIRDENNENIGS